jgi:hypothetical protein
MKLGWLPIVFAFLLGGCVPPASQGLTAGDRQDLRSFCDCASPYAALTLMVMMADTGTTDTEVLEKNLADLSQSYSHCEKLIAGVQAHSQADTLFQASVVQFIQDSLPNCSILILGNTENH